MSSAIARGRSTSGRSATSSRMNALYGAADLLDLVHQAGGDVLAVAIGDHVTRSCGWTLRQTRIALRAPGARSLSYVVSIPLNCNP
jgi:hypothetical protein